MRQGRATGVTFIDKKDRQGRARLAAKARIVSSAQSACETARILLNSRSFGALSQGLGNSTGHLGRWLTDSTGSNLGGQIPALENASRCTTRTAFPRCTPTPPGPRIAEQLAGKLGFPRGYYMAWGGGRTMPGMGTLMAACLGTSGRSLTAPETQEPKRAALSTAPSWISTRAAK